MNSRFLYPSLNFLIASVWLTNGLICKVLNLLPRHTEIVQTIVPTQHAQLLTTGIGIGEVILGLIILSGLYSQLLAVLQIILVGLMNTLEYFLARDLLLWGGFNALFALCFILLIYYTYFILNPKRKIQPVSNA